IEDVHQSQQAGQPVTTDKGGHILSQFKTLLSSHFIQEREVSFYAGKMHLTPKYFSYLIKQASGKTAGEWISEMLLLESKVRLQDKSHSIAQIA
uniref:helix-turn-helix domain-containing protein n=1 Tax=Klebsiella pneumoniae TaxID=573 RepID=UPI0021B13DBB